jgi:hypothetical protein
MYVHTQEYQSANRISFFKFFITNTPNAGEFCVTCKYSLTLQMILMAYIKFDTNLDNKHGIKKLMMTMMIGELIIIKAHISKPSVILMKF